MGVFGRREDIRQQDKGKRASLSSTKSCTSAKVIDLTGSDGEAACAVDSATKPSRKRKRKVIDDAPPRKSERKCSIKSYAGGDRESALLEAIQEVTEKVETQINSTQDILGNVETEIKSMQDIRDKVETKIKSMQDMRDNVETKIKSIQDIREKLADVMYHTEYRMKAQPRNHDGKAR
ncbi:hypothetical protein OIDMADRAFT_36510 [Oidiodendron maius Zn]|uniref:Uncharacterized protein n=1 Tax=Oidiodendron maius (strain Zn) TaxID=913774 RepID=A0A0C3C148_OIDMZ|nr:hypothetical protein OIDMADRAFT_36510 [Oidiodendron maius Zn]